jgi:hypothetical protein
MKLIAIIAVGVGLLVSAPFPAADANPQAAADNQAAGRIVGKIKPKRGPAFDVHLTVPGTGNRVADTTADFVLAKHRGEFVLDNIRPGIYRLDVVSLGDSGCGILPWSQTVVVESGKTTRITVKPKVARHAICQ